MADNNENKVLNVPHLRFPEFSGEWNKYTINDLATVVGGGTPDTTVKSYWGGDIQWFTPSEIGKNKYVDFSKRTITRDGLDNSSAKLLPLHTILLSSRATVGECSIASNECTTNQGFQSLIAKQCNIDFLYYLIQTKKKDLIRNACGSTFLEISANEIRKIKVAVPVQNEQEQIAKLLSLIDERIATQNKIIERYESLIRGIVDAIILRKPKNAVIGYVCLISKQIRAEAKIDDIITVRLHGNGVCKSNAENLQLGATQYYHRKAGQLIYGKQNFHNGAIGIVPIALDKGITSKDIPSFDIDNSKCNSMYLLAQLLSPKFYKPSEALTTGTGSKRLKEENFLKMPIVLPSKEEQDNIADLIDRITMRLDQAKRMLYLFSAQKQYLLRQMFI
ncbi:MAG: restriction endonuclease subunit S [Bacteroides thetaiotaomicron]